MNNQLSRPYKIGQPVQFHYGQQMVSGTLLHYGIDKKDQPRTVAVNLGNGKALIIPLDILEVTSDQKDFPGQK